MEGNGLEDPVMRSDITCCQVDKRWTYTEDDTFSCNFYHSSPHPLCVCLPSVSTWCYCTCQDHPGLADFSIYFSRTIGFILLIHHWRHWRPVFLCYLWIISTFGLIFLQICKTKSRMESQGSKLQLSYYIKLQSVKENNATIVRKWNRKADIRKRVI